MATLMISAACLLAFGIWYARLEYRRPIYPTYWAVVIGVGVTMAGQIVMAVTCYRLGYGTAGIVAAVVAPFLLTGVPMSVYQELKERRFIDEANSRHNTGSLGKLNGNS